MLSLREIALKEYSIIINIIIFIPFSRMGLKKLQGSGPVDSALIDTESAVMNTFDFLAGENAVDDDEENLR